jgi:pyruvate/2-oxoglutarate dehydrogenase complex dihydrolipoamide acyltransferase (E2) component
MTRIAITMPVLGFEQETGRIAGWFKQVGDRVERGEVVADIETEKVTVGLEALATGKLVEIVAATGDDVPIGAALGWLDDEG